MLIVVSVQPNSEWDRLYFNKQVLQEITHTCAELGCDVQPLLMVSGQFTGKLWRPGNPEVVIVPWLVWLCFGLSVHQFSILTHSLKLVASLLASVVALPLQLCSLHFCICSGLEKTCCQHMLCFVVSHRLLMLAAAHTYWGLLAKASMLQGWKQLSYAVFDCLYSESRWKVL